MSKFIALIDLFLADKARTTASVYRSMIYEWSREMPEDRFYAPQQFDVYRFLAFLKKKGGITSELDGTDDVKWETINSKFGVLRRFYDFLISMRETTYNPFHERVFDFSKKKSPAKLPTVIIPFEVIQDIISVPGTSSKKGIRDTAFLALAFATASRPSELYNLRLRDVKRTALGNIFLRVVRSKNGKNLDKAVPVWAHAFLEKLLIMRKNEGAMDDAHLWVNYFGDGVTPSEEVHIKSMLRMFRRACAHVGIGTSFRLRDIRATVITGLIADGHPHEAVMEVSGHESPHMVQYYVKKFRSIDESVGLRIKDPFTKKN